MTAELGDEPDSVALRLFDKRYVYLTDAEADRVWAEIERTEGRQS
jgi:hypothetical protein